MKKLLFAMATGAALAWLFDPDAGSRRRAQLQRKFEQRTSSMPTPPTTTAPVDVTDYAAAPVASIP